MTPDDIKVGMTIEVELPGVPEWSIPTVVQTATITEDNIDPIMADCREQIDRGGAILRQLA